MSVKKVPSIGCHLVWFVALISSFILPFAGCSGDTTDDDEQGESPTPGDDDDGSPGDDDDGSPGDDDDGSPGDDDTPQGPTITVCAEQTPLPSGDTCEVTKAGAARLFTGTVLTPGEVLRGGQVLVGDNGRIACVGCECASQDAGATRVDCPTGVISPGIINAHDHTTYGQNFPYTDTGERYEHRHDWREGNNGHTKISTKGSTKDPDQLLWAELRFLMGGATSIVGSGGTDGLLRNLDVEGALQEGLDEELEYDTFPLDDADGSTDTSGCDGYGDIISSTDAAGYEAYFPHVSEGINLAARNEFFCLSSFDNGGQDVLADNAAFIHSIGLKPVDYAQMALEGASLVWSPRSNITLYGDTAAVTVAARMKVNIALGSDWVPSGSMSMLRELKCADSLNSTYYHRTFTDEQLWLMVTRSAAQAADTDKVIGILKPDAEADISIFDGSKHPDHRAIIDAEPQDVVMVMRGGEVLYGDADVVGALGTGTCDPVKIDGANDVCGRAMSICLQHDINLSFSSLASANADLYPAYFCGTPDKEPSCTPERTWSSARVDGSNLYDGMITDDDGDGDGIPNSSDNCPNIFNPIRPVDGGAQGDADADGEGDACDPCPIDADTTTCTTFDPDDFDSDKVPNESDNCPRAANADQADADADGKGDVCDPCPDKANPGENACPATIYEVKSIEVPLGTTVSISNALVTGRNASGFFIQVKETDEGYEGPEFSGIFAYAKDTPLEAGDRVDIASATTDDFYGQIQLGFVTLGTITHAAEAPPEPILVEPSEVANDGPRAEELEAVLVEVHDVVVTDVEPAVGPGDSAPTNEFEIDDVLRVNDYLYLVDPFPAEGENFVSITGVLEWRNDNMKIEPRSSDDFAAGNPSLLSFGPDGMYTRVEEEVEPTPDVTPTPEPEESPTPEPEATPTPTPGTGSKVVPEGTATPTPTPEPPTPTPEEDTPTPPPDGEVPVGEPTFPSPLTVTLTRKAGVDTFVTVTSADPESLEVVGGGVTVKAGETSAPVLVRGLVASPSVTLTAKLGDKSLTSTVRVLDADEAPTEVSISPETAKIGPGGKVRFTLELDIPAAPGGTEVEIAVDPVDAGTAPTTVLVEENELTAEFEYVDDGTGVSPVTVTATLGDSTAKATIEVVDTRADHLIINELDYDQVDTDATEFIEVMNPTSEAVALKDYELVFVNGADGKEYLRVALSKAGTSLPAGGYLVVANPGVVVADGALLISFGNPSNNIQNGEPDGIALINKTTGKLIDALSYEDPQKKLASVTITGITGTVSLVEGEPFAGRDTNDDASLSLVRDPDGSDTDDAATDWKLSKKLTPGEANVVE